MVHSYQYRKGRNGKRPLQQNAFDHRKKFVTKPELPATVKALEHFHSHVYFEEFHQPLRPDMATDFQET
jgi:hypothetical protein